MKKIFILFSIISLTSHAAKIGWKGNSFSANSVVGIGVLNITATIDNQTFNPNGQTIVNLNSNSPASATRRVIPLQGQTIGQKVRVTCRPSGGNSQIDDNAAIPGGGNVRLVNNWICNQNGNSINLYWNGTDWEEDGRVNL